MTHTNPEQTDQTDQTDQADQPEQTEQDSTGYGHRVSVRFPCGTLRVEVHEGDDGWTDTPGLADLFASTVAIGWDVPPRAEPANPVDFVQVTFDDLMHVEVDGEPVEPAEAVSAFGRGLLQAIERALDRFDQTADPDTTDPGPADSDTTDPDTPEPDLDVDVPDTPEERRERLDDLFERWDAFAEATTPVDAAFALSAFTNAFFHFRNDVFVERYGVLPSFGDDDMPPA
jgi:hypothetical protein